MADAGEDRAAPVPDAGAIVGLLADEDRRRVFAALVLGGSTLEEVRASTGLPSRRAATALARLVAKDLVVRSDEGEHLLLALGRQRPHLTDAGRCDARARVVVAAGCR